MKKTYTECDVCGTIIEATVYHLRLYLTHEGEELPAGKELELCRKCALDKKRWLKKAPPRRTPSKVDHGMAFALRRRGWTNTQIAEEFGVEPDVMEAIFRKIDEDVDTGKLKVEGVNSDSYQDAPGRVKDVI